ncbi:MAG: S1 RNA-binding domain-containing protein, partial [candidate division WOR-3 bacterium]
RGQKVETIILGIDRENRRITLGLKQTQEDPFYLLSRELKEGDVIMARILDLPKPGVVVALPHGIEGFVPLSQLARGGKKAKENYQIGEEIQLKVMRVDLANRRVTLSERALLPEAERSVQDEHDDFEQEERPTDKFTLEDHIREEDGGD